MINGYGSVCDVLFVANVLTCCSCRPYPRPRQGRGVPELRELGLRHGGGRPRPAPAPEKINGAAKLFGAAVNGIEKDKNDNKIEQPRKSGGPEAKPLPAEATAKLEAGGEQAGPQQPKRPSYRVLEDPDLDVAPPSRPGALT